jgi:hypothetical protein
MLCLTKDMETGAEKINTQHKELISSIIRRKTCKKAVFWLFLYIDNA